MNLTELLDECNHAIEAGESQWDAHYTRDEASFKRLLKAEDGLVKGFKSYFKGLSERVPKFFNYSEIYARTFKAYDVVVEVDATPFADELAFLSAVVIDDLTLATAAGIEASLAAYKTGTALSASSEKVLKFANKHAASLVKDLNATTRKQIARAIESGIASGEDIPTITERVAALVNDPKRAERIARTESVNAYSGGIVLYGKDTGASHKTWQTVQIGACRICTPLDGKTVGIDEDFETIIGPVSRPAAHVFCRCGLILAYPDGA